MKKVLCSVLALALLVSAAVLFASCAKEEATPTLVCGITNFDPMNYKDADGNWTGFDTEFAQLVGEKLGMEVKFQEIEWPQKYNELAAGTIDCIWNGFTANSNEEDGTARKDLVDFTYSYMLNQQCIVVKAANKAAYTAPASIADKNVAVEDGSAGDAYATDQVKESTGKIIDAASQISTLPEVKSGAADCAVIDVLLAKSMTGKGDYADLAIADVELPAEVYAVGFAKGSELTVKVNDAIKALDAEGKLAELAEKYGLENSYLLDTAFAG